MSDDKTTPGDVKKLTAKVEVAKAFEILQPKIDALLTEVLKGFELSAGDVKSRKNILQAAVQATGGFFVTSEALELHQIARRASLGVGFLYEKLAPKSPAKPELTAIDGGLTDEDSEEDDADDGDGENDDD